MFLKNENKKIVSKNFIIYYKIFYKLKLFLCIKNIFFSNIKKKKKLKKIFFFFLNNYKAFFLKIKIFKNNFIKNKINIDKNIYLEIFLIIKKIFLITLFYER
ncbi:hypothetical protein NDNC_0060 [Candidatus Nasuia deltocephalinicola]|nr:hypothetical protein QUR95_00755 [Candidatus Nasuia deltocephalinicola]BEH03840.1 hypothetical protein NDNC_0060 [Candidatus Nasuia deltocephalinicola]